MRGRADTDRQAAALLLGVTPDADPATIRRAFRAWASLAHPDAGGHAAHFAALCSARDVLLASPPPPLAPPTDNCAADSCRLAARTAWRDVLRVPSPGQALMLAGLLALSVAAVLAPLVVPVAVGLAVAALAATATSVVAGRLLLEDPDVGHVIVARTVAWLGVTLVQCATAAVTGVPVFEALPLLAVPFVVSIAMVNPGAGLWIARHEPRH